MTVNEIKMKFGDRFPYRIGFEKRIDNIKGWHSLLITIGAVVVALLFGAVILALVGGNPFAAYGHIFRASFGSIGVLSDTLVKATPLLFVGLACFSCFPHAVMEHRR